MKAMVLLFVMALSFDVGTHTPAEWGTYFVETDTGVIALPFKHDDVKLVQATFTDVTSSLKDCTPIDKQIMSLPTGLYTSFSVKSRGSACRLTIDMERLRRIECLLTREQHQQLASAFKPYTTGKTLPNFYTQDIQAILYKSSSCSIAKY